MGVPEGPEDRHGPGVGLSRRALIGAGAAGYAGLALGGAAPGWARKRKRLLRGGEFRTGVLAGFPGQRRIHLTTRVAGIERGGWLELVVARDPGFRRVVHHSRVRVRRRRDFTAHATVGGLRPGEDYWYAFSTRTTVSRVGHFRTRRPPDSREPVRIGYFSCQGWQPGYYTAHAGLANEDLDLAVSLGDYIYELTDDDGPREDKIGPNGDGEAQTLAEYRQKYHLYQSDANLQAMHAAHSFACVWDDHETESGWRGEHEGETQGRERRVPFEQRLRNGIRAFFEHLPVPRFEAERRRVYRSIPLGRHAELILMDLHGYGDAYPCGFQIPPRPCPEANDPSLTMLGARQKRWVKRRLEASPATWKVLGSSLMMMALDFAPGVSFNPAQWDGYVAERRELMQHCLDRGIGGVAVISGDIHTFFAGQVTTTGRADGTPAASEFVGGAISSEGINQGVAEAAGLPEDTDVSTIAGLLRATNPHYAYLNTARRGYGVLECRRDELRVRFRSPRTVYEPESPVETLAEFVVEPGDPTVHQV